MKLFLTVIPFVTWFLTSLLLIKCDIVKNDADCTLLGDKVETVTVTFNYMQLTFKKLCIIIYQIVNLQ